MNDDEEEFRKEFERGRVDNFKGFPQLWNNNILQIVYVQEVRMGELVSRMDACKACNKRITLLRFIAV